jgi:DNA topoisomerase-3
MKSLILAEKPSVARDYARVLGCRKKEKGFIEGNKYIITWSLGHLVTLAEPADYDKKYKTWQMEHLPIIPDKMKLKVIRKTAHQFRVVKMLLLRNDVQDLIIATDAGREGELVARWIMKLSRWKKEVKRLWISSQTDKAILDGFAQLKKGKDFDNLYEAARCRAEADWLVGLNVTRALTCKYNSPLSAGRVQTPTLSLIIKREEEINQFRPKDYWTVRADFGDFIGLWTEKNGNSRLFDQEEAKSISQRVKNKIGEITEVKIDQKKELPPLAFDLTELQREANRRYSFSAKKTLSVMQNLYENHKFVTYPRTDSRYITRDIAPTMIQRLESIAANPYAKWVNFVLEQKEKLLDSLPKNKRIVNDDKVTDHHAIIPSGERINFTQLSGDEKKILDLIIKRFLTILYPPYFYNQISLKTEVDSEIFVTRGRITKEKGWRQITQPLSEKDEEDQMDMKEQVFSIPEKGEKKPIKGIQIKPAKTRPPARYTEATLLTAMENPGKFIEDEELRESIKKGGLGTPATRADIIEKLLNNFYAIREGKELVPTSRGIQLLQLVPGELKEPELTAKWELRLSQIAEGAEKSCLFLSDIIKNARMLVNQVKKDTRTVKFDEPQKADEPGHYSEQIFSSSGKKKRKRPGRGYNRGYSDQKKDTTSIGDLLESAIKKK